MVALALAILAGSWAAHKRVRPYPSALQNGMESWLLASVVATLALGATYSALVQLDAAVVARDALVEEERVRVHRGEEEALLARELLDELARDVHLCGAGV